MYRGTGDDPGALFTAPLPTRGAAATASMEALYAQAIAAPCGSFLPSEQSLCMDGNWLAVVGACKFGLPPPPGVTPGTWQSFCDKMKTCGIADLPACPSVDAAFAAGAPPCLDQAAADGLAYCDQYGAAGPDPGKNAFCWAGGKMPTVLYNLHAAPPCDGVTAAGIPPAAWWLAGAAVLAGGYYVFTRRH